MAKAVMGIGLGLAGLIAGMAWSQSTPPAAASTPSVFERHQGPKLERFTSRAAFETYLRSLQRPQRRSGGGEEEIVVTGAMAPAPPPAMAAPAMEADASASGNPEITNNQTIGVDEGGIVKQIGRHLVVLQDGRVFSVDLAREGERPRLADRIDVYRNEDVAASWYDEMLVLGDRVLVTAYNYRERASELTVLRLDPASGRIRREGRFLIGSDDYYSTDNYATRLVGDSLVFYAPYAINGGRFEWPRLRRADGDAEADRGGALFGPTDIYAPPGKIDYPVIHAVSICPLNGRDLACKTTAFIGPAMREFFVSPSDAFVWIGAPDGLPWSIDYGNRRRNTTCPEDSYWNDDARRSALLYKLPLDGGRVGAVAVDGIPADQFAFESSKGRFRALLADATAGCFNSETRRTLSLLDIPLTSFGPRLRQVARRAYTPLPPIEGGQLENRFVGDWLVYGGRSEWDSSAPDVRRAPLASTVFTVPLARPSGVTRVNVPHNAVRIERAGRDAVVTGYRDEKGLSLSYLSLGSTPRRAATTTLPGRFESEGRSHAFNAWVRGDGGGLMGIPTTERVWRSGRGWSDSESSELSFIAIASSKTLDHAGELALKGRQPARGYACKVSCVDWYGNSRPIFTGGRIFALMGTELVEGSMTRGRIGEVARVDLTGPIRIASR